LAVAFATSAEPSPVAPTSATPTRELSRKTVNLGTHKATYIRITPPQLPPLPAKPAPVFRELTPEEKAEEEAQAAKTHEPLGFSCTVYVGTPTVTELVWWSDGKPYRAWSNVNFQHLTQLTHLETATHIFSWFPMVVEIPIDQIPPEDRPAQFALFKADDNTPTYYFGRR
jgi:hypothetical protein